VRITILKRQDVSGDWIHLAQDRNKWQALCEHKKSVEFAGNFLTIGAAIISLSRHTH
jgi:hypothetical protein